MSKRDAEKVYSFKGSLYGKGQAKSTADLDTDSPMTERQVKDAGIVSPALQNAQETPDAVILSDGSLLPKGADAKDAEKAIKAREKVGDAVVKNREAAAEADAKAREIAEK